MNRSETFFLSTNIEIGVGSLHKLAPYIQDLNFKKVGLLIDSNLGSNDYLNEIIFSLEKLNLSMLKIYNSLGTEPTYSYLEKLTGKFKDFNPDIIIAFGGGSTIDLGKGIALLLKNQVPALSLKGFPEGINSPVFLITVPSVFGSGSEVSYNAVFVDETENRKLGINSKINFPKKAFIDPLLTMTAPEKVVLYSALDSLVHCIDSFGSTKHTTFSKMYSINGFRKTFSALLDKDLSDPQNRLDLAMGSIFGIIALMNSGDGPTNGFAYYFGVKDKIPHGLAGGIFLKEVMKWNFKNGYKEYYKLLDNTPESKPDLNLYFIDKLEELYKKFKIPMLKNYGYTKSVMSIHAKNTAKALSGSFEGNPVQFDIKSAEEVLFNLV